MHSVSSSIYLRLAMLVIGMAGSLGGSAQTSDPFAAYEAFRQQAQQSYLSFRQQCMKDYADFVRWAWDTYEGKAPIPQPEDEKTPPVICPEEDQEPDPEPQPVIIEEVVEPQPAPPQPEPIEPVIEKPQPQAEYLSFSFFGTEAKVRHDTDNKIVMRQTDGNAMAEALLQLDDGRCDNMLFDCLYLRAELNLCDWAYLMMLKELAYTLYGKDSNEAVMLMAYLYMQSGYKMRLAEMQGKLYMLFASDYYLFGYEGYELSEGMFFGVEKLPNRLNICQASFPNERSMSMLVAGRQQFAVDVAERRERTSKRYPDFKATVSVNRNWLDFCSSYPTSMFDNNIMTRWALYANTPMAKDVVDQLYPQLIPLLEGKSQLDAVNILLNWVQTGFEYEYDDKVWGGDRAFFAEESLNYPYCDCEDRSILFTRLVRDLLGLKCILVFYPGHLAAAVRFTDSVSGGDYIQLNGQRYIVSDPTYIGAPVGMTMPDMDNQTAKVILLE